MSVNFRLKYIYGEAGINRLFFVFLLRKIKNGFSLWNKSFLKVARVNSFEDAETLIIYIIPFEFYCSITYIINENPNPWGEQLQNKNHNIIA